MKKLLPLLSLWFLLLGAAVQAQNTVLFVNDNGVFSSNTDTVQAALTAAGISFDVFNARDSLRSPTAAEMQPYKIVIWYCSTDGVGNYLWNGTDTDNMDLLAYLEAQGSLWLMGNDFMYDRYGSAPVLFEPDEFPYARLGISAYSVQSYGDDGGMGVPELDPDQNMIGSFDTLRWIFTTAWWVDGCVPAANTFPIYVMGPESYSLQGYTSALFNYHSFFQMEREITFFFDPALIDTYSNRVDLFRETYELITMPPPPGFAELPQAAARIVTGANPATDKLVCNAPEAISDARFDVHITDMGGRLVYAKSMQTCTEFTIDISKLEAGAYLLSVSDSRKSYYQKFVVSR